jgi:hypothetical protein
MEQETLLIQGEREGSQGVPPREHGYISTPLLHEQIGLFLLPELSLIPGGQGNQSFYSFGEGENAPWIELNKQVITSCSIDTDEHAPNTAPQIITKVETPFYFLTKIGGNPTSEQKKKLISFGRSNLVDLINALNVFRGEHLLHPERFKNYVFRPEELETSTTGERAIFLRRILSDEVQKKGEMRYAEVNRVQTEAEIIVGKSLKDFDTALGDYTRNESGVLLPNGVGTPRLPGTRKDLISS